MGFFFCAACNPPPYIFSHLLALIVSRKRGNTGTYSIYPRSLISWGSDLFIHGLCDNINITVTRNTVHGERTFLHVALNLCMMTKYT